MTKDEAANVRTQHINKINEEERRAIEEIQTRAKTARTQVWKWFDEGHYRKKDHPAPFWTSVKPSI